MRKLLTSSQNVRISTKTLNNHLKLKHKIIVKSCNKADTPNKSKTSRIDCFFKKEKESLSEVIAQLVAKDCFSCNQIAKSRQEVPSNPMASIFQKVARVFDS